MNIKDVVFALTHPNHWLRNEPTCIAWDEELNRLLEEYPANIKGKYTAQIGPAEIWVANYPYSCGNPRTKYGDNIKVLPKRRTVGRLKNMGVIKTDRDRKMEKAYDLIRDMRHSESEDD